MINRGEILQTIEMIDQQHLDVRTVTMGISLLDCCDTDAKAACRKIYDKITRSAKDLVRTGEEIEAEFAGKGYGDFKMAVGQAVADHLAPIREKYNRLMNDKPYLESCYRAGAEKASRIAGRTLEKVYKKVGFLAK